MKKVIINFEYDIPEKNEVFQEKKDDIIEKLMNEKKAMKSYLLKKQEEINDAIDDLIKGSNITEAENFINEVNGEQENDLFSYIGQSNQDKINEIYLSYRDLLKAINTFEIMKKNGLLSEEEKEEIIEISIKEELNELNEILDKYEYEQQLNITNLLIDKDCYDKEIANILINIKKEMSFMIL